MAKNFETRTIVSEKIISSLTGQVGVDKEKLISNIALLRDKPNSSEDVFNLGITLYKILIENGLNESDMINPKRLFDKVEGLIYEKKFQQALEILVVLDAIEPFEPKNEKGEKIYYVNNIIEAGILKSIYLKSSELVWNVSLRESYLQKRAEIFELENRKKDAEMTNNYILKLNPVSFDSLIKNATILKQKSLEKFKSALFEAQKYAYQGYQMVEFYKQLASYYFEKKNYLVAFSVLWGVSYFDDPAIASNEFREIEMEANKNSIQPFKIPTEQEVERILHTEKIPLDFNEEIFLNICETYCRCVTSDDEEIESMTKIVEDTLVNMCKGSNEIIAKLKEKIKKQKEIG